MVEDLGPSVDMHGRGKNPPGEDLHHLRRQSHQQLTDDTL